MKMVAAVLAAVFLLTVAPARAADQASSGDDGTAAASAPTPALRTPTDITDLSKFGTGFVYKFSRLLDSPSNPGACLWKIGPETDKLGNEISPILFIGGYIRENGHFNYRVRLWLMGFRHLSDGRSVRYTITDATVQIPLGGDKVIDMDSLATEIHPGSRYEYDLPFSSRRQVYDAIVHNGLIMQVRGMENSKTFIQRFAPPQAPAAKIYGECLDQLDKDVSARAVVEKPPAEPKPAIADNAGPDDVYLAYVDQAMADPARGNWGMIRALYPGTSFYQKIGGANIAEAGHDAFAKLGNGAPDKTAALKKFIRENFASVGVHFRALALAKSGQAPWLDRNAEAAAFKGLVDNILHTGDSRSLGTALKLIDREEAGFLLATAMGGKANPDLTFKADHGILYMTADAVWPDDKTPYTAWFIVDDRAVVAP